jgi:two-component system, cell cycle sensor histidine kinase and response regulator CckA
LLTVIHLSTRLLQRQLHAEDPLWEPVQRIREAGERATSLTKQLLSFSRREMVEPQVLNLNRVVEDLNLMLQRIIGENIQMVTVLAKDLWLVDVDPSQMDQVIVNLVVNARDAMPGGGTLTIETANVVLDEGYVAASVDAQPGEHVMLAIGDTGSGMAEEVKAHLFEPFFTTKQRGQGTGLGLPTVFGIVKQNEGHIRVHSEVGVGTTVRIYLPSAGRAETPRRAVSRPFTSPTERLVQGTETLLVVEDEAAVRELAVQVLESCGYRVLEARNGLEALRIGEQHDGPIHLLLTDVVMPEMNGKELANRLQSQRPAMRVLYMSGYADDTIIRHGVLAAGTSFLSKPLTLENLTQRVRAVLDGRL